MKENKKTLGISIRSPSLNTSSYSHKPQKSLTSFHHKHSSAAQSDLKKIIKNNHLSEECLPQKPSSRSKLTKYIREIGFSSKGFSKPSLEKREKISPQIKLRDTTDKMLKSPSEDPKKKMKSIGTQKNFKQFPSLNFNSMNTHNLLREIAKQRLQQFQRIEEITPEEQESGKTMADTRKLLFKETIRMMQEQLFFEEFLIIMQNSGVDLEKLLNTVYSRLDINSQPSTSRLSEKLTSSRMGIGYDEIELSDAVHFRSPKINSPSELKLDLDLIQADEYSYDES